MKLKLFASLLAASTLAVGALAIGSHPSSAQMDTYFCGKSKDGVPTTYSRTATGKRVAVIRWQQRTSKLTPEARCQTVSAKFQKAYEEGLLNYLTWGIQDGQKVVCSVRQYGDTCREGYMLFTLLDKKDDPTKVAQDVMNGAYAASGPVVQSEDGSPQYYYDMNQFLREAPTEE